MKHILIILALLPFFTFCGEKKNKDQEENSISNTSNEASAQTNSTTYYLIRHAEKTRTDPENQDPRLTTKGIRRAKGWAKHFDSIALDEIYTTSYLRTIQTVSVIAKQKNISPKHYEPHTLYSEEFLKETYHKNVLIAGHSNTIPHLVNKLIDEKKFKDMDDTDNATLFKVIFNDDQKTATTLRVD
ncbi:SixA phosphatase family protein [Aequorivita marina]|uniref:SixA phosphatase family protein n=1 Tax=Aequorivita marina TaxID=3073654 RepID=UPI002875E5E2|nr:phosphoglycerate mutase family protein [Aequorivita sp. S2608]MDS1299797.1 phosphoglycerate mutase family protein [Aequorivita sp. S2608]